jgi:hypothetical protein
MNYELTILPFREDSNPDTNPKIAKVKLSFDTPKVFNIPKGKSSIFDDFRNFSKKQSFFHPSSTPKKRLDF